MIDPNHPVKVVNQVIDSLDIDVLIRKYKGREYSIHQTNDTTTLQSDMESLKDNPGKIPETLVTDAGYGSEENYEYLEKNIEVSVP